MSAIDMQYYAYAVWMIVSIITFIAIIAWALWPSHRQRFERYGTIPLRDDDEATS
jgi:cbb3-type cytochrome oxidase subunit 3